MNFYSANFRMPNMSGGFKSGNHGMNPSHGFKPNPGMNPNPGFSPNPNHHPPYNPGHGPNNPVVINQSSGIPFVTGLAT